MRIDTPLLPHQRGAIEQLRRLRVGAVYMEPGTGKTRVILDLIRFRVNKGKISRVLWFCPCDKKEQLQQEISSLTGDGAALIMLHGMESLSHSWPLFVRLREILTQENVMLVVDGGHMIKNPHSLRTRRILLLGKLCSYRLLASETPLTCSVEDMYAQWLLLDWRILGYQSFWSFAVNHLDGEQAEPGKRRPRNVDYLLRRIRPYVCQVLRSDCQIMDERTEYIWKFRLDGAVMDYYRAVVTRYLRSAQPSQGDIYRILLACQMMTGGRSISSLRPLATSSLYRNPNDNPRIRALMDVLSYFPGQRILILCRFTHEIRDVMHAVEEQYGRESVREYVRAPSGQQPSRARILVMNRLCSDPAPGTAHEAEIIIHYSLDWDWGKRRNAEFRTPAATRKVVSLTAVNTIDTLILNSLKHKQNLVEQVRQGLARLLPEEENKYAEDIHG